MKKKKLKNNDAFWKTVKQDYLEVQTWPAWKQKYVITAKSAKTGNFIKED